MSADRDKFANKNVIYGIYLKDGIGFMHQNMKQTFIALVVEVCSEEGALFLASRSFSSNKVALQVDVCSWLCFTGHLGNKGF